MEQLDPAASVAVACGWCRTDVLNFVHHPHLVEIRVHDPTNIWPPQFFRVCSDCHVAFIKFQLEREPPIHDEFPGD